MSLLAHRRKNFRASATVVDADMFWDGQGSSNVTVTQLNTQNHGGDGGTFTITDGDPDTDLTFSSAAFLGALRNSISVNGVTYTGNGTTGFKIDLATDTNSEARYALGSSRSSILVSFDIQIAPDVNFTAYDLINIESQTGASWSVLQIRNDGVGACYFNAHSENGIGGQVLVTAGTIYHVQVKYEQNVAATIAVWKRSDWSFIGSSTLALGNNAAARIKAPHIEQHGNLTTGNPNFYTSNYVFKYTGTVPAATTLWP